MIAGLPFAVEQAGASLAGFSMAGSLAQVASGGYWKTTIALINSGTVATQIRVNFFNDSGIPLTLPLTFPQTPSSAGPLLASTLERTINPGAVLVIESAGPDNLPPLVGWAQLLGTGNIGGFAVFQQRIGGRQQEAVVPLENRNARSFLLYFDNTNKFSTGVSLAATTTQATNVTVTIRDDAGTVVVSNTITLPAQGHTSFDLVERFPLTAQKRGTVEFSSPASGHITPLGIRFTSDGAFSTIPVVQR
ncbi:MAG: hypothetical protein LC130_17125 [Bryobacterales bacterium]|nr:hypothetical protein [Bryobacterales bacterium]